MPHASYRFIGFTALRPLQTKSGRWEPAEKVVNVNRWFRLICALSACRSSDGLFLAMADTGAHTAFFTANLSPTFARLLHSHEILSNKQLGVCTILATNKTYAANCKSARIPQHLGFNQYVTRISSARMHPVSAPYQWTNAGPRSQRLRKLRPKPAAGALNACFHPIRTKQSC